MINSTAVLATRVASHAEKRRTEDPAEHAPNCSSGGLATKIHMLCNAEGMLLYSMLSGGQASDITHAQPLLDETSLFSSVHGRSRKRCKWLLADKGYDCEMHYDDRRINSVITLRSMKRRPRPGLRFLTLPSTINVTSSACVWLLKEPLDHHELR